MLGVGSQELLKNAAHVFLSPTKHLVIPSPTYGDPAGFAQNVLKYTVKSAPVTAKTLKTDLSVLLPLVKGAGLVYLCNPNNPTGTINSAQEIKDFIAEVKKTSPTTGILIDEAYCDYATDPVVRDRDSDRPRDAGRRRRAHVLEGLRHGRRPHRLRGRGRGDHEEDVGLADAVQRQHVRRRGRGRLAQGSAAHQGRERPQQGGARLHGQGARRPRLQVDRLADQLHLHRHRQDDDGSAVPRRSARPRA